MKKQVAITERGYDIVHKDPYLPRGASGKTAECEHCGAVYMKKRWYLNADAAGTVSATTAKVVCPACLKIRDNFPGGIVTLSGQFMTAHKDEFLHLIRNEEQRARGFNPLERVMSIKENGEGSLVISTTNEKLAQRLGRAFKKAFNGDVTYRWSRNDKLVRVEWARQAA